MRNGRAESGAGQGQSGAAFPQQDAKRPPELLPQETSPSAGGRPRDLPAPLERASLRGWARVAMWGLRVYIALMLILVAAGFARGLA